MYVWTGFSSRSNTHNLQLPCLHFMGWTKGGKWYFQLKQDEDGRIPEQQRRCPCWPKIARGPKIARPIPIQRQKQLGKKHGAREYCVFGMGTPANAIFPLFLFIKIKKYRKECVLGELFWKEDGGYIYWNSSNDTCCIFQVKIKFT